MRRIAFFILVCGLGLAPAVRAQDHVEVGAFVDYFRLHDTGTNFVGLGGRAAFNVARYAQLEAEMSYDFNRAFTEGFHRHFRRSRVLSERQRKGSTWIV